MRNSLLVPVLLATAIANANAQAVREEPPPYYGPVTLVNGVFVTPIAGVPFAGTVSIESEQILPDGTVAKKHSTSLIARDASGRIHNERRLLVPDTFKATPPLLSVHLFDPATRVSDFYNPMTLICREQTLPPQAQEPPANLPNAQEAGADLGVKTVSGFEAKGTRVTRTVPAQVSGTGKPEQIIDETWYSEELHMNLRERHTDQRSGVQTVTITAITRGDPDAALFEVPAGYKIVDMTPPAEAPIARANQ